VQRQVGDGVDLGVHAVVRHPAIARPAFAPAAQTLVGDARPTSIEVGPEESDLRARVRARKRPGGGASWGLDARDAHQHFGGHQALIEAPPVERHDHPALLAYRVHMQAVRNELRQEGAQVGVVGLLDWDTGVGLVRQERLALLGGAPGADVVVRMVRPDESLDRRQLPCHGFPFVKVPNGSGSRSWTSCQSRMPRSKSCSVSTSDL
jgi:hypothetical protein